MIELRSLIFFLGLMGLFSFGARADFVVPELTGPLIDQVGMVDSQTGNTIRKLASDVNSKGVLQVQVLIVPDLAGLTIEEASIQVVDKWKLGDKKTDKGLLIMVAAKERKMRIEVGRGLEGEIPDVIAKRIVADVMTPYFKKKQYGVGILAGILASVEKVAPDYRFDFERPPRNSSSRDGEGELSIFEVIFLIMLVIFVIFGRFFGMGIGRRGFGGGFYGGGGFGGGGSGGGWGGGGGGFSGGGASGDW